MSNKYLEKIAIVHFGLGYAGADKGDKLGGSLLGGTLGGIAGAGAGASIANAVVGAHRIPTGAVSGYLAGAYLGGKAYSRVKDVFRSKAGMAKHLKRNGVKDD